MGWVEALAEGLVDMDKMSLYVVEDTYSQDLSVISSLGYPAHRHGEVFCRCMEVWQSIKNIEKIYIITNKFNCTQRQTFNLVKSIFTIFLKYSDNFQQQKFVS